MRATEWAVVTAILACLTNSGGFNPPHRGAFVPSKTTTNPNLVEGDMAVQESQRRTGLAPRKPSSRKEHIFGRKAVYIIGMRLFNGTVWWTRFSQTPSWKTLPKPKTKS